MATHVRRHSRRTGSGPVPVREHTRKTPERTRDNPFGLTDEDNRFDNIAQEFRHLPTERRIADARAMEWRKLSPEYLKALEEAISEAETTVESDPESFDDPEASKKALEEWRQEVVLHRKRKTLQVGPSYRRADVLPTSRSFYVREEKNFGGIKRLKAKRL